MSFDLRGALTSRALAVVPGVAYNKYRQELADRSDGPGAGALFFEAALPETAPWPALAESVLPQLARFAAGKDLNPESPRGVVVSLFLKDHCYVLRADELLRLFCELEGLNAGALHFRVQRWLNVGADGT